MLYFQVNGYKINIGVGTIAIGLAGNRLSWVQVIIGILQFCIWITFIRYIWTGVWSAYIIFKGVFSKKGDQGNLIPPGQSA